VTTTTVERDGAPPRIVAIRDGWYIDTPALACDTSGDSSAVAVLTLNGERPDMRWRGRARTGTVLEERDRMFEGAGTFERQTELVEVSGAPIPPATFDVPDGYQPALPMPGGGHDLTRADTIANRAVLLWTMAAGWIQSWWQ
jgi:hypothetical protein